MFYPKKWKRAVNTQINDVWWRCAESKIFNNRHDRQKIRRVVVPRNMDIFK